eukprot:37096_1
MSNIHKDSNINCSNTQVLMTEKLDANEAKVNLIAQEQDNLRKQESKVNTWSLKDFAKTAICLTIIAVTVLLTVIGRMVHLGNIMTNISAPQSSTASPSANIDNIMTNISATQLPTASPTIVNIDNIMTNISATQMATASPSVNIDAFINHILQMNVTAFENKYIQNTNSWRKYRLDDVFLNPTQHLGYEKNFPNSIASEYLEKSHHVSSNYTLLSEIVHNRTEPKLIPSNKTLVVYITVGDVINSRKLKNGIAKKRTRPYPKYRRSFLFYNNILQNV